MRAALLPHLRPSSGLRIATVALMLCALQQLALAEPVPVRYEEGTVHGFLALRTSEGRLLAVGDLTQVAHGDRVTVRVLFRFNDGSVDDETTVYLQRKVFQMIRDRHIQKGPFFPHSTDLSIDARSGQVIVKSVGKDGKQEVVTEHLDLPPDLANGITLVIAKNLPSDVAETRVSFLAATPKPRLVKLVFSARGEDPFSIAGLPRKATRLEVKVDLGGVAGVLAPLVGKQPADHQMWIVGGEAPDLVKEEGSLYEGGPTVTIAMTSPDWPRESSANASK